MNRFFATSKHGEYFDLNKETLDHLKVLRITSEAFIICYEQKFYECILVGNKAQIIKVLHDNHEHKFDVILACALIKYERFEWLLQKATELGVTKIIPLISDHVNGELYKYDKFEKKRKRFETIIQNAAEQSFRNIIPTLTPLTKFSDALLLSAEHKILAHEKINISQPLVQPLSGSCIFYVGPEGGFSDEEVALALENNCHLVSLGSRILRAETASIFLLSNIKIS